MTLLIIFPVELKICGYNGSSPVVEPLSQEASVLEPDAGASCLEDASRIPPPLEDSLEPFESLDRGKWVKFFFFAFLYLYNLSWWFLRNDVLAE